MAGKTLLILGDQLSHWNSALRAGEKDLDVVLMVETSDPLSRHHKIKRAFQISAMRHFAEELREKGWTIDYHSSVKAPIWLRRLRRISPDFRPPHWS